MTSKYYTSHLFVMMPFKDVLCRFDIIKMEYIQIGTQLSNHFQILKDDNINYSLGCKRCIVRIWRELLEFFKLDLQLLGLMRLARQWYREDIWEVLKTCIILHNMIIEDKRDQDDITHAEDTPYRVDEALVQHERGSCNIQIKSINRSIINDPIANYNL
ncbi:hypothetical protein L3X38_036338 [Prunus dulcis]|uniref:Uncharacterized protein n=1 Tax=Prunus dulcis TaxID=3755 RepID=A0AAD4V2M7_PRUDU|nr:hypothetical protein L3X38_036338 [Prunus dulcis]